MNLGTGGHTEGLLPSQCLTYWEMVFETLNSLCLTKVAGHPKFSRLGIVPEGVLPVEEVSIERG